MTTIDVTWRDASQRLDPGDVLTFGRDGSCTIQLDAHDRGLSRVFGRVAYVTGVWWVINVSTKRTLHVIYETGLSEPLPVAGAGWPEPRRAVDTPMRVLVPGFAWTHELVLTPRAPRPSAPIGRYDDVISTVSQLPPMTDNRREALIALAYGYLQMFPHYDPRPRTYAEAADLLQLRPAQVRKRIESLRTALVEAGVTRLEQGDARAQLAEWALAMRVVTADDVAWLRGQQAQRAGRPMARPTPIHDHA